MTAACSELHGVSLARYASVLAGLAQRLPLDRLLASEGVDAAAWPLAAEAWGHRVAEAATREEPLADELDGFIAEARERYAPRVSPLDDDLRAWLDFHRAWSTDPDPVAFLARLQLRPGDLLRLHRTWSSRIDADAGLRAEAHRILAAAPGPLPQITISEALLHEPAKPPAPQPQVAPPVRTAVPAHQVEPAMVSAMPNVHVAFSSASAVAGEQRQPLPHEYAPPAPEAPRAASQLRVDDVNETLFLRVQPEEPALPFGPPPRERPVVDLDETALPIAGASRPLPFEPAVAPPEQALARADAHAAVAQGPRAASTPSADETAVPGTGSALPTLPFEEPRNDPAGETAMIAILPEDLAPAVPFASAPLALLTLEQYASLLVDVATDPDREDEILSRYGLSAEAKRAEDLAWQTRMTADSTLRERFQLATAAYRAWR